MRARANCLRQVQPPQLADDRLDTITQRSLPSRVGAHNREKTLPYHHEDPKEM
jgi:hypothetical protein